MPAMHRVWWLGSDREGFVLRVVDRRVFRHAVEVGVEWVLVALGHPCCGRGVGRLGLVYVPSNALLYGVLGWASRGDRVVAHIRLTEDQARALDPGFVRRWLDDDLDDAQASGEAHGER
jgi:hypothetical protein